MLNNQQDIVKKLAYDLLERFGNYKPSSKQVSLMMALIQKTTIEHHLWFHDSLSQQELLCLLLAAQGKSAEKTADLLNIKRSSVKDYRQNILRKLECKTMTEAVFKGFCFGKFLDGSQNETFQIIQENST